MKAILVLCIAVSLFAIAPPIKAQEETMSGYYLLPIEHITEWPPGSGNPIDARGPKYFQWRYSPAGIDTKWSMMDYGFVDSALLYAPEILPADHAALILNADVFAFPDNLDAPVTDPNVDTFFEAMNIPTNWLTPATTYRELMRQTAGMMQFNQRYSGISSGGSIFDNADLSTRLRQMTTEEEEFFYLTAESFGIDRSQVNRNSQLRQLVKSAGDIWIGQPFYLGGVEF